MQFLKTKIEDIPQVMEIIRDAQKYLCQEGIDQWQNDYPNPDTFKEDIKNGNSYVIKDKEKVIAAAAIIFADDPTYARIYEGQWLSQGKYGVIHRAAVAEDYKGQGIASLFFKEAEKMAAESAAQSLRIDTHQDNLSMQRLIEKENFKYCGIIYTESGSRRLAYEKLL